MAGSPLFGLISLILTAGACVMTFFVILGGTSYHTPLNNIYFLWADTSNISNAPVRAQWTLWGYCSANSAGLNTDCTPRRAAYPFTPQTNFGTTTNVPADFTSHYHTYYYLSRFMFAFFLVSIFFMVCSLFTGLLALCSRLGSAISALTASIALLFITTTASLMTACFVLGRNHFRSNGQNSQIGEYAFAFTWASVACMFLSTVMYCLGFSTARRDKRNSRMADREMATTTEGRRVPFFRTRRASPAGESEQRFT